MKKILEINSTNYASTGNIMLNIAESAKKHGYDVYMACKASSESYKHLDYNNNHQIIIGYRYERIISSVINSLTGLRDHLNIFGTYSFIKKIKKINPDLIHLHVLHDDFINTRLLFKYLSNSNIPVVWTFHDCNALTGKCPYFDMVNCDKWKKQCNNCPQQHLHPNSYFFDTSKTIYKERKKCYTSISNLTIVSPSVWLNNIVKESFFKNYNVKVINNGINLNIFKRVDSSFKQDYRIENKMVILGVANVWNKRKGIDVFIELANNLSNKYQIVLVGTNDEIDKLLPSNIISIHRTYNQKELAKIYSAADVFVNPTREENFPTVNIEALACGLPVITFNTGGSPEIIDEKTGIVVPQNDISALKNSIFAVCENKTINSKDCINHAQSFDMHKTFEEYIKLYDTILNNNHL